MNLHLTPTTQAAPDDYDPGHCRCPKPNNHYQLGIDAGQVILRHATCGLPPHGDWWIDAPHLDPVPVQVTIASHCDGNLWHGLKRCECDSWAQITIPGVTP